MWSLTKMKTKPTLTIPPGHTVSQTGEWVSVYDGDALVATLNVNAVNVRRLS